MRTQKKKTMRPERRLTSPEMKSRSKWNSLLCKVVFPLALAGAAVRTCYDWEKEYVNYKEKSVVAPRNFNFDEVSEANRLLLDFPNEIPGTSKVDKYITPDAKYTLVHIRQSHLVENISDEKKETVAVVQSDIYKILDYLAKNKGLKEIYTEGVFASSENLNNDVVGWRRILNRTYSSEESRVRQEVSKLEEKIKNLVEGKGVPFEAHERYPNDNYAVNKYISDLKKDLEKTELSLTEAIKKDREYEKQLNEESRYEGVYKAAVENGIEIRAAEDEEANMLASLVKEQRGKLRDEVVLDYREDILLNIIANQNEHLIVVVYGGNHEWGGYRSFGFIYDRDGRTPSADNIHEWNREHPKEKFSLIEITPESYHQKK